MGVHCGNSGGAEQKGMPVRIKLQGLCFSTKLTGEPRVVYTGDMSAQGPVLPSQRLTRAHQLQVVYIKINQSNKKPVICRSLCQHWTWDSVAQSSSIHSAPGEA